MPRLALGAALLLAVGGRLGAQTARPGAVFYVAHAGDDRWSGTLAAPNADRTDGPFATLERAREAIRGLKQVGLPAGGVEVRVRAGVWERATAFALTVADAGTEAAPIVYRAFEGERVVLTGAKAITGFVPDRGQIVKADVGAQGFKDITFRQLFHNGRRQQLARYPNFDPANPHGGGFAYVAGEPLSMYRDLPEEEVKVIHCRPADVRRWAHPEQAQVILFPRYNWINMDLPAASADPDQGTITLAKDVVWGPFKGIRPLDRYYVRNLPEELDAPGEWWLDKATWTLHYWPPEPLDGARVSAPVTDTVVALGPRADWITIQEFEIEGCDGSAVTITDSEHCRIVANAIHDTGGSLGYTAGVFISGGHDCGVIGNDIYEVGNYGIRLQSSSQDYDTLTPTGHFADNNYLHHIGVLNGHGCGIYLSGVALRVSHNLIHDTTRCGIFGGGPDCLVEYNHIRHVNLETEDTGGYYCGGNWHIRGQVIRYNYIHDVLGYGRDGNRWVSPHFGWGIYLDDDHSGTHVYGNIVARTTLGGSHIHAGRDNVLENNIFIDGARQQMQYSGHDPASWVVTSHRERFAKDMAKPAWSARYPELAAADVDSLYLMAGNKFLRNIVYYRHPDAALYRYSRNDVPDQNESDYNLIWHHGLPLNLALPQVTLAEQWATWQQQGFDTHSLVADPMFVDPEHDDYRLRPESPALKLGFKPIPVDEIGPYASPLRATWPIVEAPGVREVPLVDTVIDLPAQPVRVQPEAKVPTVGTPPVADGVVRPGEWPGQPLRLAQHPDGSAIATAPCELRLAHDATHLYVSVTIPLKSPAGLKRGATWEQDDAAECCFQDLTGPQPGPVYISHGFANGVQQGTTEGGAPAATVARLNAAIRYAAQVGEQGWTGEWAIPLEAAGIALRSGLRLAFNAGVRRTESNEWVQWHGSGSTYTVARAGVLVLE